MHADLVIVSRWNLCRIVSWHYWRVRGRPGNQWLEQGVYFINYSKFASKSFNPTEYSPCNIIAQFVPEWIPYTLKDIGQRGAPRRSPFLLVHLVWTSKLQLVRGLSSLNGFFQVSMTRSVIHLMQTLSCLFLSRQRAADIGELFPPCGPKLLLLPIGVV